MDGFELPERILRALVIQMLRSGTLPQSDIEAAADEAEAEGDDETSHNLRCLLIRASAPRQSEWEAERRRARMRLVPTDGGNPTDPA